MLFITRMHFIYVLIVSLASDHEYILPHAAFYFCSDLFLGL